MGRAKFSLLITCFLAATVFHASIASAASSRQVFGAPEQSGKIKRLDLQAREILVGKSVLRLSPGVAVYTHRGFETTVESLKKGMRIAFNVIHDAAGSPRVSVIWILSKKRK